MNKYTAIASRLADKYLAAQEPKTATAGAKTFWDRVRPEHPDRPGANWWTGLGTGAMGASAEYGLGEHGLTDLLRRHWEKGELKNNPFGRLNDSKFQKTLAGDDATKFLTELFKGQEHLTGGPQQIGTLLANNFGPQNIKDPKAVANVTSGLQKIIDPLDLDMSSRFSTLTADAAQTKKLMAAFGQFTQGQKIPTRLTRLGRAGSIGGLTALAGAYALPSLVDFGKWVKGN